MGERNANLYTSGTSALKMPRWVETPDDANIIQFPRSRQSLPAVRQGKPEGNAPAGKAPASKVKSILESSEMYCSLKLESMLGCPYNLFSRAGIAALSVGASAIALVSLILGA